MTPAIGASVVSTTSILTKAATMAVLVRLPPFSITYAAADPSGLLPMLSETISSLSSIEFYFFQIVFGVCFPLVAAAGVFVALKLRHASVFHKLMFAFAIYTCFSTNLPDLEQSTTAKRITNPPSLGTHSLPTNAVRTLWIWLDPFVSRGLIPNCTFSGEVATESALALPQALCSSNFAFLLHC